jgi:superfamily II DNA/RNA helicase
MGFEELGLGAEVLRAVKDAGYTEPTPIQSKAIPYVLMGRDVLGGAQTGTGKTASFTLPMIDILAEGRAKARMPRTLILCPTRELAAQVAANFDVYGKYHKLSKALLIGGVSFAEQDAVIDRGADVLIATPGRLLDHFERGKVLLNDIKILVIDEADRMLDMGFIPDVERIVDLLPKIRQTLFFSATIPPEIRSLADKFLINPKEIYVSPPASTSENVEQHLVRVGQREKRATLRRLLKTENVRNALIFCNRKRDIGVLTRSLQRHEFDAEALHGDMHQEQRTQTLARFKKGEVTLLVASDVAARGLDILDLSHVFNFDVPMNPEDYVHRIGRTARAGRSGRAFTLVTPEEGKLVQAIERLIGAKIPVLRLDGEESEKATTAGAEEESPKRSRGRGRTRTSGKKAATKDETATSVASATETEDQAGEDGKAGRKKRAKQNKGSNGRSQEPVLAFGDDVPAFFKQEIPLRAR